MGDFVEIDGIVEAEIAHHLVSFSGYMLEQLIEEFSWFKG